MSGDFPWILIIGPLLLFGLIYAGKAVDKRTRDIKDSRSKLRQLIDSREDFKASHCLIKFPYNSPTWIPEPIGLAIDDQSKQVCLINGEALRIIKYGDIIESEVIAGGDAITKTSRTSQFAGAAVGGLLLGGAGAVIGGLSGKTVTKQDIKDVWLKLLINDTSNPVHALDFIGTKNNGQMTDPKVALKEAQEWHGLISVIIRQAEQEFEAKSTKNLEPVTAQISFAEQISQLSELHKSGVLTDDEFIKAKKKLLDVPN